VRNLRLFSLANRSIALLVEAAQAVARMNPESRRRYIHMAMRRHKSIAKIAMARKLGVRLYGM
jgi:transposase